MTTQSITPDNSVLLDQPIHIGVVSATFNDDICQRLRDGVQSHWQAHHNPDKHQLTMITAGGAVELPWLCKQLAKTGKYDAIIALGAVVKGETEHYHWVSEQASQGCQQVALTHDTPVIFGVLTTANIDLALARSGGEHSDAGQEAMQVALDVLSIKLQLEACR